MKQLLKLLVAGAVCGMGFVGCGLLGPADSAAPQVKLDASIGSIGNGNYKNITGEVTADEVITDITYTIETSSGTTVASTVIKVSGPEKKSEKSLKFTSTAPIKIEPLTATAGEYNLVITVTAGPSATLKFPFTVTGTAAVTLTEKTGTIANVFGPDTGSFDLVNGKRIASAGSSSSKDLLDMSLVGAGFAGKLGSDNGTKFVAASASDYTAATDVSVKALAASATADNIAISNGTVFVAKLGSSRGYAIVKITRYNATAGASTGANKGEADFSYKFTVN